MYVYLMTCRAKDNKHVVYKDKSKKDRKKFYFSDYCFNYVDMIAGRFRGNISEYWDTFVKEAEIRGEKARLYRSLNECDEAQAKKLLLIRMIENEDLKLTDVHGTIVSCLMNKSARLTKRWLIDIDFPESVSNFDRCDIIHYIRAEINEKFSYDGAMIYSSYYTPNGYHIITEQGFDSRDLMSKWGAYVTIKKDGFMLLDRNF